MNKKARIRKIPGGRIVKYLEKYRGVSLFPDKVAKANETLARIGLPKAYTRKKSNSFHKTYNKEAAANLGQLLFIY